MSAYRRQTIKSVTCFLKCGHEYLFVHRNKKGNNVDADKLNGIGGKLEHNENFLQCALRETAEETGYKVVADDCQLSAVINMHGGYEDDWLMCFFVIDVPSKKIPIGMENDEGELIWIHQDKLLDTDYKLVDDLRYGWQEIINPDNILFASVEINDKEQVETWNQSLLTYPLQP